MNHEIYIYLSIIAGTFLEGEATLLAGAFSAHQGYSNVYLIGFMGFVGVQLTDWFHFLIARIKGREFLNKRKVMAAKVQKFTGLLDRNLYLFLTTYRFIYGARTIIPFSLGLSQISTPKFAIFCTISSLAWATLYTYLGFAGSKFLSTFFDDLKKHEWPIIISLLVVGFLYMLIRKMRAKNKVRKINFEDNGLNI
ncbi:DedA family protein [Ekhidna sp.]|uniref:DedA family protein n=1 Tax=Ekhidna sp. TaxID=2608089 RepID=UPI003296FF0D